jgi:hypothetical protein
MQISPIVPEGRESQSKRFSLLKFQADRSSWMRVCLETYMYVLGGLKLTCGQRSASEMSAAATVALVLTGSSSTAAAGEVTAANSPPR